MKKNIYPLCIHDLQQLDETSEEDVCTSDTWCVMPVSLAVNYGGFSHMNQKTAITTTLQISTLQKYTMTHE